MWHRVEAHRRARPAEWLTVEKPLLSAQDLALLDRPDRMIIIDCLATLATNRLLLETGVDGELLPPDVVGSALAEQAATRVLEPLGALLDKAACASAKVVMVTNEVGWGLVPFNPLGRLFRDLLGRVNQMAAARASEVHLLVAGIPMRIK